MFMLVSYVTILMTVFFPAKGQISLSFCQDPIEGEECYITCTTPGHNENIFFRKTSTPTITIASCISGFCGAVNPYIISQPTGTTTVLKFNHTRGNAEEWQCEYGSSTTTGILKWGTYPTTITATDFPTNTNITSEQEADVKLTCLYSEHPPGVTLFHTDSSSNSVTSSTPVTCTITNETCSDSDFETYTCKVIISPRNDLLCTETYSLGVSVKISNIQTPSNSSALGNGITYECQTLSTHLDSTSDVSQSTLLITTDGGIKSLNTSSNLPDETMILSSILPTIVETPYVFSQIEASSNKSLYHTSNTHTTAFLITTLTSSIFDGFISFSFPSSLVSTGYTISNSFTSNNNTMTSKFSMLKTRSEFYNSLSTVDDLESSNLRSLSRIYISESTNGISLLNGNMIFSSEAGSLMSSLQGLTAISQSDSFAQDLWSQVITSTYKIVSTQGSHIDHTPLTSFTSMDNLQSSLDISYDISLSPSSATYMAGLSTQTLLFNHSMKSEESLTTIPTTLSNIDPNSMLLINSPITSFGSSSWPRSVRPTIVDISTSINSLFGIFEKRPSILSVNSLQTQSLIGSEIVGIIMSNSLETANGNIETLFESLWIAPSSSLHMHESLSPVSSAESESGSKANSSDNSVLFDTFSIIRIESPSFDSTAYISNKNMLSISVNSNIYSSATNIHLTQPKAFVSTIVSSVHPYFYTSYISMSSSLLVTSSVHAHPVLTNDPSLTKTTKVIAISVTVVACIFFVALTILVLFVLKLLQCKSKSNVGENSKEFSNTDSKDLNVNDGERRGFMFFDTHYGLPRRYYDNTAMSWSSHDDRFMCNYNTNWDDIT